MLNNGFSLASQPYPRRVISGVQPTGVLHLGNYFGAIKPWIDLQNNESDVTYFIADLHSMTMPHKPDELRQNILQQVATLLACGIDPTKANLFAQSSVPQHAELCWIFTCLTTMARLAHLPQYKDKSATLKDVPTGLFIYPILQAADILLHKWVWQRCTISESVSSIIVFVHRATHVPCGEDQIQQLQLAADLSRSFNKKFGRTFPDVTSLIADDPSARIRSLRDPTKKQSKSDPDTKSRVTLLDPPDVMMERIKKALTDFKSEVTYEPQVRPGVANLITIHSLITNQTPQEVCDQAKDIDTGKWVSHTSSLWTWTSRKRIFNVCFLHLNYRYKLVVADAVIAHFSPIRERILDYMKNRDYLTTIMVRGAEKAQQTAEQTIKEVKEKVGLHVFR